MIVKVKFKFVLIDKCLVNNKNTHTHTRIGSDGSGGISLTLSAYPIETKNANG